MYLKNIKLAGFKSFADVVNIPIRSQINAIVGPNGCGKSNVIDAIRWVIGESSAKQLRGQSMADVVFNGTSARKPVGRASVELLFDNTAGRLLGEYAAFSEISIRREVGRDGQSNYFINNTNCRRRDVIDIFLGTGLGPNSYAIVEQGMISRLIESKPDELRVYLEEAAGISKYRERRRETENRMRHTQENLDRLNDLRDELERQLRHLKKQANAAERYQELKQEERLLQVQIKASRWQILDKEIIHLDEDLQHKMLKQEELQTLQTELETKIEKSKELQIELQEEQNNIQRNYYAIGTEIARIEQQIQNIKDQTQRWKAELSDADTLWEELSENLLEHKQQIEETVAEITELEPQQLSIKDNVAASKLALESAQTDMQVAHETWDDFQQEFAAVNQQSEIDKTKVAHAKQEMQRLELRIQQLTQQNPQHDIHSLTNEIDPLHTEMQEYSQQLENIKHELDSISQQMSQGKTNLTELNNELNQNRKQLQTLEGQYATLHAQQQVALGLKTDDSSWLENHSLQNALRLGQTIQANSGWELAVETVLSNHFDAVCVDSLSSLLPELEQFNKGKIGIIERKSFATKADLKHNTLLSQVACEWPLESLLANIYIADDIQTANQIRQTLLPHESVITKDGIWMGPNWVRLSKNADTNNGILLREQALLHLQQEVEQLTRLIETQENQLLKHQHLLNDLDNAREQQHHSYRETSGNLAQIQSQLSAKKSRLTELEQQSSRSQAELAEYHQQKTNLEASLAELVENSISVNAQLEKLMFNRQKLLNNRDHTRMLLDEARLKALSDQQRMEEIEIRLSSNQSQLAILKQAIARSEKQLQHTEERRETLRAQLSDMDTNPLVKFSEDLQQLLTERNAIEVNLKRAEKAYQDHLDEFKKLEKEHQLLQAELTQIQNLLQDIKMERQALLVRQTTLQEQIAEASYNLQDIMQNLPQEMDIVQFEQKAEWVNDKIQRLGAINLAAIDEYQTVSERKDYLDKQNADLVEALNILEQAIRKMDQETRAKFRDTYERVNEQFQTLFPRIFAGGKAYLELCEDDLLTTGVLVRAQPPGKRNATIHMLSGGEKALTAIALVFALFQLNPAPFCILDEVDAPLDDLNVGRFGQLVKEMSRQIQFIVISHNKLTIETADHLMGVTMQEAGVSRLVAVDMQQALEMAAA